MVPKTVKDNVATRAWFFPRCFSPPRKLRSLKTFPEVAFLCPAALQLPFCAVAECQRTFHSRGRRRKILEFFYSLITQLPVLFFLSASAIRSTPSNNFCGCLMWTIPLPKRFCLRKSQSALQKIPFETSVRDNDVTPRLPTFIVPVGDLRLHVV